MKDGVYRITLRICLIKGFTFFKISKSEVSSWENMDKLV